MPKTLGSRPIMVAAVLLLLDVGIVVGVVWPSQRDSALRAWEVRLSGIADQQQEAIDRWLAEREGDARVVGASMAVRHALGLARGAAGNGMSRPELRGLLEGTRAAYGYRAVALVDDDGRTLAAATQDPGFPYGDCLAVAAEARRSAGTVFAVHDHNGRVAVTAYPVPPPGGGPSPGVIVLEMDARRWLYPFLTREAVPTRTAEALLVGADGINLRFLSPLRQSSGPPLSLRLPHAATPRLAAACALSSNCAFGPFVDYRGMPVLAVGRRLHSVPWGLVVKVDRAEALEGAYAHTRQAGVLLGLATLCLAAVGYAALQRHRRIVESRLASQAAEVSRALKDLPDVLFLLARDGYIREVWGDAPRVYGHDAEWLRGRHARDIRAPDEAPGIDEDLERAWERPTHRYETRHLRADGEIRDVEIATKKVWLTGEESLMGVIRDVTERRQAERRTLFHNRLLRMLSAVNEAMVRAEDADAFLNLACRSAVDLGRMLGSWIVWQAEGGGAGIRAATGVATELAATETRALLAGPGEQALREGTSARAPTASSEETWAAPLRARGVALVVAMPLSIEGTVRGAYVLGAADAEQVEASHQPLLDEMAADVGFAVASIETRRREAEANLRIRMLSRVIEQARPGVLITDADGRIEYVNPSFTRITQYGEDEALGATPRILQSGRTPRPLYEEMWGALAAGREWRGELQNRRKDGELYWAELLIAPIRDDSGRVTHYMGLQEDVSDARQAQAELDSLQSQLAQSQRLEAIGRLAGGIAHDFNNLLGVIIGCADALRRTGELASKDERRVEQIAEAGQRAASLTHQLLAFSRRQLLQPRVVEVADALAASRDLLGRIMGEDVELRFDLAPDVGRIRVDPSQLDQVVLNLAVNARDAMPRGGTFRVEARNVQTGDPAGAKAPPMPSGSYVMIRAADTGHGIDPQTLPHIFEPFFTTKPEDKGSGLGLATVYGIVKQSGGSISATSELGRGTAFTIYLPRADGAEEPPEPAGAVALHAGERRVLLVEDQAPLRGLIEEMLRTLGYAVVAAADGPAALEQAARDGPFDLLLTDVVMPGMSGPELARRLAELQSGLHVLYMSGYTDEVIVHHGAGASRVALLAKPFTIEQLAGRLQESLAAEPLAPPAGDGP